MYYNTLENTCQDNFTNLCSTQDMPVVLSRISERIELKNKLLRYYKTAIDDDRILERILFCGTYLGIDNDGKIGAANFCKNRLCPVCNYRKSSNAWGKIYRVVCSHNEKYKYLLITLTVRNCSPENLTPTIDDMMESFKRITNRKTWKNSIKGFVRGLEVTFNSKENTFHPHIHILCAVPHDYFENPKLYIPAQTITEWWQNSARLDYRPDTDVKAVNDNKKGVAEVAKYSLKMSDILSSTQIDKNRITAVKTLYKAVFKRRLSSTAGVFRGVKLDDDSLFEEKKLEYAENYGDYKGTLKYFLHTLNGFEDITFKDFEYVLKAKVTYEKILSRRNNLYR